ncbi:TGS domain-containing protein [candidate division WWE3 bacterium]|uniref:TGS domain-containing protein n=1 Tax=candidate division WWE3 bacterium TaxID=2053526 RepID=A0A955LWA4_UNCKA|nr:TGS domain-containing protein [candidate division WWE3 bacterium]
MEVDDLCNAHLLDLIKKYHHGIMRAEGTTQIQHLLNVSKYVMDWTKDQDLCDVALVHDIFDPKNVTEQPKRITIQRLLNDEPFLVLGDVLRIDATLARFRSNGQIPHLGQLFLKTIQDIRSVLVTLAEIKDAVIGIDFLEKNEQQLLAQALMKVYAPMCTRLGNWCLKTEFEDHGFRVLEPQAHSQLQAHLDKMQIAFELELSKVVTRLEKLLEKQNIQRQITIRWCSPYSLYRRLRSLQLTDRLDEKFLQKSFMSSSSLHHMATLHIIVGSIPECYTTLGILHSEWRATPDRFVDYISNPKETGYSALHTRISSIFGRSQSDSAMDIQIQTLPLARIAEYGICRPETYALWKYHALGKGDIDGIVRSLDPDLLIRAKILVKNLLGEANRKGGFTVFTPEGRAVSFRKAATPLDFAYAVHSEIGYSYQFAEVNGVHVTDRYRLQEGDVVRIYTSNEVRPSEAQLKVVQTKYARAKINMWLNKSPLRVGKRQLKRHLDGKGIELTDPRIQSQLAELVGDEFGDIATLYEAVGSGAISPKNIVSRIAIEENVSTDLFQQVILGPGMERYHTEIAGCCNPKPPEPISAYGPFGLTMKIHHQQCHNMRNPKRIRVADWHHNSLEPIVTDVEMYVIDRIGFLYELTGICLENSLNIESVSTKDEDGNRKKISLRVHGKPHSISYAIQQARELPSVIDIAPTDPNSLALLSAADQLSRNSSVLDPKYPNPYRPGQPIVEQGMFFGRRGEIEWFKRNLGNNFAGAHLLLIGQRRVGKTSLLRYVEDSRIFENSYFPVFIDLQAYNKADETRVLNLLISKVARKLRRQKMFRIPHEQQDKINSFDDPFLQVESYIDTLHDLTGGRQLLILFDEFDALINAYEKNVLSIDFFTYLRTLMQKSYGPRFVFCGSLNMVITMERLGLAPILSATAEHQIGALDRESAISLISQPLGHTFKLDRGVPQRIAEITGGYPFFIHHICFHLFERAGAESRLHITHGDVKAYINDGIWNDSMFSHLWNRSEPLDRNILTEVSLTKNDRGWCDCRHIYNKLENDPFLDVTNTRISDAVHNLVRRGALTQTEIHGRQYCRIAIPLFESWLRHAWGIRELEQYDV